MIVMWGLRFFVFKLHESPKYLMGRGRDEQAVQVVHFIAMKNGKKSSLSIEDLRAVDAKFGKKIETSAAAAAKRKLTTFSLAHVKPLFATRKLAYSTTLLIIIWGTWGPIGHLPPPATDYASQLSSASPPHSTSPSSPITFKSAALLSVMVQCTSRTEIRCASRKAGAARPTYSYFAILILCN